MLAPQRITARRTLPRAADQAAKGAMSRYVRDRLSKVLRDNLVKIEDRKSKTTELS